MSKMIHNHNGESIVTRFRLVTQMNNNSDVDAEDDVDVYIDQGFMNKKN